MLAASWCSLPATMIGSWTAAATRQPSASAVRSSTDSHTTTNSSPPSRATVSAGRTAATIRSASAISSSSPAAWPNMSLTRLKLSMSTNRTAALDSSRSATASACRMRSRHSVRFASPVSESCSACWRICSSRFRREKPTASTLAIACRKEPSSSPNASSSGEVATSAPWTRSPVWIGTLTLLADRPSAPQAAISRGPSSTSTRSAPSTSRTRSAASRASSDGSTPRSARSPSAATAACCSDCRRSRDSDSRRSEMLRPIASSSGPSSLLTMPQLISPMNSEPSLRRPYARSVKRSGWSSSK